jgi:hypothetical protein
VRSGGVSNLILGRHHVLIPKGVKYFLCDQTNDIVYVLKDLVSAAHAGFNFASGYNTIQYIAAASTQNVVVWYDAGSQYLYTSTDGNADSFSQTLALDNANFGWGYLQQLFTDMTSGDIWSASYNYPSSSSVPVYVIVSADKGLTWTQTNLFYPHTGYRAAKPTAIPRHDGSTAFIYCEEHQTTSPYHNDYGYVFLVNHAGTILETYTFSPQTTFTTEIATSYYRLWAMGIAKNNPNLLYGCGYTSGKLWQLDWTTKTWTLNTNFVPGAYQTQIVNTRLGTMLLVEFDPYGTSYFVSRSTDNGATWTRVDLTAFRGSNYITPNVAVAQSNQIITASSDGTVLYSDDDGVTWSKSAVILPVGLSVVDQSAAPA